MSLLNVKPALFLIIYGSMLIVSVIKKNNRFYVVIGFGRYSKNSFLTLAAGIPALTTGLIALYLYLA